MNERYGVLNPESIGDPDQTPIVQVSPTMAAYFEGTRCTECGYTNHCHKPECSHEPVS